MSSLACTACDWHGPEADVSNCPQCGGTIDIIYASDQLAVDRSRPGIWRYGSRLPLPDPSTALSLGEGQTPLLRANRLGEEVRLSHLFFKLEGANPTGSYKDRIAAVGISRLRALGKSAWAATSSGNAGAAIAAYGARAGVDGYLFTLEKASRAKIAQILSYGPTVMAVDRLGYDPNVEKATWDNVRTVCEANDWMMLVTARAFSPHAMEGVKTIAYEVSEQLEGEAPDVVYVPVGGGGLLSTAWKGFVEAKAAGWIDRLPRMVSVQPCHCDAVNQAWRSGHSLKPISDCVSTISGLQLTSPPDGDLVLQALAESDGWAVSVPDEEAYEAQAHLAAREGVFVEPASAITLAAVRADRAAGRLLGDERVICLLTGSGFKDAEAVQRMAAGHTVSAINAQAILDLVKEAAS